LSTVATFRKHGFIKTHLFKVEISFIFELEILFRNYSMEGVQETDNASTGEEVRAIELFAIKKF
jgi:hypothetical protein